MDSVQLNRKYSDKRWIRNWNENIGYNINISSANSSTTHSMTSFCNESLLFFNNVQGDKYSKIESTTYDDSEDEDYDVDYLVKSMITVDKYHYDYPNTTNTTNNENICNHKMNDKHTNCNNIQNICNDRWKPLYVYFNDICCAKGFFLLSIFCVLFLCIF